MTRDPYIPHQHHRHHHHHHHHCITPYRLYVVHSQRLKGKELESRLDKIWRLTRVHLEIENSSLIRALDWTVMRLRIRILF